MLFLIIAILLLLFIGVSIFKPYQLIFLLPILIILSTQPSPFTSPTCRHLELAPDYYPGTLTPRDLADIIE